MLICSNVEFIPKQDNEREGNLYMKISGKFIKNMGNIFKFLLINTL